MLTVVLTNIRKNCLGLLPLTATAQASPNYQLSQPEIEYGVIEKCMWHCACAEKTTLLGQEEWGWGERTIGPIMLHSF